MVFTIYGCGGLVGHVTQMQRTNFIFPLPKEAPHKNLAVIGQTVFEKMFKIVNKWRDARAWVNYKLT